MREKKREKQEGRTRRGYEKKRKECQEIGVPESTNWTDKTPHNKKEYNWGFTPVRWYTGFCPFFYSSLPQLQLSLDSIHSWSKKVKKKKKYADSTERNSRVSMQVSRQAKMRIDRAPRAEKFKQKRREMRA